uniref:Uncharacterized protein n=1 Tax=Anguilla anguilla TaxID=7936 RepID=A0A0E9R8S7_ANGAN
MCFWLVAVQCSFSFERFTINAEYEAGFNNRSSLFVTICYCHHVANTQYYISNPQAMYVVSIIP